MHFINFDILYFLFHGAQHFQFFESYSKMADSRSWDYKIHTYHLHEK